MIEPDWIAVDWGTSALRVWAMGSDDGVVSARQNDRGMGALSQDAFEPALLAILEGLLPDGRATPVICCGMVGARQGWVEAPYVVAPCAPPSVAMAVRVPVRDPRLRVHILPGIRQDSPPDVMRGEETQIAGFLAGAADFDGVICLPGTHTKWALISAGEIVSFRTFMTGELFALLAQASVLRHGLLPDGWDAGAFAEAVDEALSRPQGVGAALFSIRAEGILRDLPGAQATARLSGLLIGLELAGARPYWLGQNIRVLGSGRIAEAYEAALAAQGVPVTRLAGDDMVLRGLVAARAAMKGELP